MRILVATDGSEGGNHAVEFAARLAKNLDGQLKIVHVTSGSDLPPECLSDYARWGHVTPGEYLNDVSEQILRTARTRAEAFGVSDIQTESRMGDIAVSIIDTSRCDRAEVIVLGKRGLGRLAGLLLGSVSQKVVSAAPCGVIVVP